MIAALLCALAVQAPQAKELTIVFVSNRQGQVAPCHCESQPLGGLDRQVAVIADIRAKKNPVLVLDGGDNFFDSKDQSKAEDAPARAALIADALAQIRPEVMMPGERDFLQTGPVLRELGLRARAPWLVSNILAPRDRPPMVLPAHIAKLGDQKVLLLGVYQQSTFPPALKEEKYAMEDPLQAVRRYVAQYRSYVDLIVVMAHTDGQNEEKIAEVDGVSLVLGSHEGRLQFNARRVGNAQIVSAGNQGKYLVRVDLRYASALPALAAGSEVQKYFRDLNTQLKKPMPREEQDKRKAAYLSTGFGTKDTLLFQLMPLGADCPSDDTLREKAKAIDPQGYEMGPKAATP